MGCGSQRHSPSEPQEAPRQNQATYSDQESVIRINPSSVRSSPGKDPPPSTSISTASNDALRPGPRIGKPSASYVSRGALRPGKRFSYRRGALGQQPLNSGKQLHMGNAAAETKKKTATRIKPLKTVGNDQGSKHFSAAPLATFIS